MKDYHAARRLDRLEAIIDTLINKELEQRQPRYREAINTFIDNWINDREKKHGPVPDSVARWIHHDTVRAFGFEVAFIKIPKPTELQRLFERRDATPPANTKAGKDYRNWIRRKPPRTK